MTDVKVNGCLCLCVSDDNCLCFLANRKRGICLRKMFFYARRFLLGKNGSLNANIDVLEKSWQCNGMFVCVFICVDGA